jgi:hypothetical protein
MKWMRPIAEKHFKQENGKWVRTDSDISEFARDYNKYLTETGGLFKENA